MFHRVAIRLNQLNTPMMIRMTIRNLIGQVLMICLLCGQITLSNGNWMIVSLESMGDWMSESFGMLGCRLYLYLMLDVGMLGFYLHLLVVCLPNFELLCGGKVLLQVSLINDVYLLLV